MGISDIVGIKCPCDGDMSKYHLVAGKPEGCPIIGVRTPHGRLIDVDEAILNLKVMKEAMLETGMPKGGLTAALVDHEINAFDTYPTTVIEPEKDDV